MPNSSPFTAIGRKLICSTSIPAQAQVQQFAPSSEGVHGKFTSKSDYMDYGANGYVRHYLVDLKEPVGAYRTIDGGAIEGIDVLPDGSGFLTISDRPSITNWTFDPRGSTRIEYTIPLVVMGRDMGIPIPIEAFALPTGRSEVLASYIDHSVRRFNLETGEAQLMRQADVKGEPVTYIASLAGGAILLAEKSGRLKVYTPAQGADRPAGEIAGEPLSYLGRV